MKIEDVKQSAVVVFQAAPRVKAPADAPLLYVAPSARGQVVAPSTVRFQFKNGTGGLSFSEPLEVVHGQECEVES